MKRTFIFFDQTKERNGRATMFNGVGNVPVSDWMKGQGMHEDLILAEWMKRAPYGAVFNHRAGLVVRVKDPPSERSKTRLIVRVMRRFI